MPRSAAALSLRLTTSGAGRAALVILCAALTVLLPSCAAFQQFVALRQVDFSLAGVADGRLAGVPLSRIAEFEDLSAQEASRIAVALVRGEVPFQFRTDIRAVNPADNAATATMVRLAWTLFLDDRETISGALEDVHSIPPGETVIIPLEMSLDLREFFDGSAESLVRLAAGLAGLDNDPTRVTLSATPTIDTALGPISYPSPITIEWGGEGPDGPGYRR